MLKFKKKKVTKQRGSKTHGWGSMKKHRGAGHRGGRGNAGSGKRGDAKKPTFQNDTRSNYLGKRGFVSIYRDDAFNSINLAKLSFMLDSFVEEKKATKKGDVYTVDLSALGYQKLLGSGKITKSVNVSVMVASQKAVDKINAAKGKVISDTLAQTEKPTENSTAEE